MKITVRLVCLFCAVSIGTSGVLAAEKKTKKVQMTPGPQIPAMTCEPMEFRSLALLNHAPTERGQAALAWLQARATICKSEQLRLVRSNLGQWLGTALTPEIESVTDAAWAAVERKKS